MCLFSPPSKQESIKLLSIIRSLLCGNLVYKVKKSKFETEVDFLRLLSPFICISYCFVVQYNPKSVNACKHLHLSLCVCICLKIKWKINVIVMTKCFIEDLRDTVMNLALMGFYTS